jgi:hypothetical protein
MNKHFRVSGSTFVKLEELGVRASAVLRRAGLPQGFIDQPRVLLKTEELFALWRAIGEVSANPAIGLLLGTETKTERFHPIGLAALSTENFGSAIDQMARYKQLTCPEEILQEKDDKEWSIEFRWLLANEVEPPVLIECCFAWVVGHQNAIRDKNQRVLVGLIRSFWQSDASQVRSSDAHACLLHGRLHSRLLRSASPARVRSRCSSPATRRS